jgi:hypothetical protein
MTEPVDPNGLPTYEGQPYGPQPAAQQTPPLPTFPARQAPHRRRNVLITVLAALVAIASTIGGYLVFTVGDPAANRLAIPDSFDGYTRLTTGNAGRLEASMRSMIGGLASSLNGAVNSSAIGVYARNSGDTPRLIALVLPSAAVSGSSSSAGSLVDQLRALTGPSGRTFPPGPHGGESACGTLTFGTVDETMCAWSDSVTAGVMVSVLVPMTPRRLSGIENDFRAQVD